MKSPKFTCLLILLMTMICNVAHAYDIAVKNDDGVTIYYNWINDSTELEVTERVYDSDYQGDVSIPEAIIYNDQKYSVTRIGDWAFSDCTGLTSISLGNSLVDIGIYAFYSCSNLTSVVIPDNVEMIGDGAFEFCTALTSVTFPSSLKYIGGDAFAGCEDVKFIVKDLAAWCNIVFTLVDAVPFTFPTNPLENGYLYSDENTLITDLVIPEGVTSISDYAFYGYKGLTSVSIPSSVMSIGVGAFSYCENMVTANIPNSVTSIGSEAFSFCSGLTSLAIPSSVTSIGKNAFIYCSDLTSITVDTQNTKYDSRDNCNAIIETASSTLLRGCQNTVIPNDVKKIDDYAFSGSSGLTSVTIPSSVSYIGGEAFGGCKIEKFIVRDLAAWCNIQFGEIVMYYDAGPYDLHYPSTPLLSSYLYSDENTPITDLVIPEGVASISKSAFHGCRGLTSVTIPNSVTEIETGAFARCKDLKSVNIGNSVETIGLHAFSACDNLTSMNVNTPNPPYFDCPSYYDYHEYEDWYSGILNDCNGDWSEYDPYVPDLVDAPVIGWHYFSNCENATLHVPYGTKEIFANTEGWCDFGTIVDDIPGITPSSLMGDADGDYTINITDVMAIIDYILGRNNESFIWGNSDLDENGIVNITDAMNVVDMILSEDAAQIPPAAKPDDSGLLRMSADVSGCQFHTSTASASITGIQMDVVLQEGCKLKEVSLLGHASHTHKVRMNPLEGNRYRVVVFSAQKTMLDTDAPILHFETEGKGGFVSAESILCTEDNLSTILSRDLSAVVTGINTFQANSDDNNDAPVYSISGQRVSIPQKGIHITHGHKILVK